VTVPAQRRERVLAVATHPIQYQAPWFRALAAQPEIDLLVLFVQVLDAQQQGRGFGVAFEWDIPLREGYASKVVPELRGPRGLQGFFSARIAKPVQLMRQLAPDVVLLTGWQSWSLVQMLLAARWLHVPVIMRGESNALRTRGRVAQSVHRALLSQCAAFLSIGRANTAFYTGYGVAGDRLFTAPYFVENERFRRSAEDLLLQRDGLRARWGIPPGAVCWLYAGKLESKKRILDLLAAFAVAVKGGGAPLHLLVVGTGELMEAARAAVDRDELPVSFAGFLNQTEMPAAYVAADALVLPSDYGETWGLVVNEAMSCGRPALVSDRVGCGPDLVTEGETGSIFPFADVAALADALVRLSENRATLSAMGQRAQERVLKDYSVETAVKGTLAAVRAVRVVRKAGA
jgi:glycosyltransferase involved in cell wall biosynthesis